MGSGGGDAFRAATDLPPGQVLLESLKVKHYGRVPVADPGRWRLSFTADDGSLSRIVGFEDLASLPTVSVRAGLHCASGWSVLGLQWSGVPARTLVELFPPPPGTVGVLVYAEYGYSANLRLADLMAPTTLLATELGDAPLAPEHGFPVRLVAPHLYAHKSPKWFRGWEYLTVPRRGFWEERGYHVIGDPWQEQRYSYQE